MSDYFYVCNPYIYIIQFYVLIVRVDSALRALSTLRGLRGTPEVPPLCRETQSLGQQMLKEPLGINGLSDYGGCATKIMIIINKSHVFLLTFYCVCTYYLFVIGT